MRILSGLLVLTVICATPTESPAFQSVRIANDTAVVPNGGAAAPALLAYGRPHYSEQAWKRGITGSVTIEALFDIDGNFKVLRVVSGLGFGLDETALDAVQRWRFAPATLNGSRVPVLAHINVPFNIAFAYADGDFRLESGNWQEYSSARPAFSFVEIGRDESWITIFDRSRSLSIRLPLMGGHSFWSTDSVTWTQLYDITPETL